MEKSNKNSNGIDVIDALVYIDTQPSPQEMKQARDLIEEEMENMFIEFCDQNKLNPDDTDSELKMFEKMFQFKKFDNR